jgi:KDO2-lipid IV(A) lauroyltransferase
MSSDTAKRRVSVFASSAPMASHTLRTPRAIPHTAPIARVGPAHRTQYLLYRAFSLCVSRVGDRAAAALGSALGSVVYAAAPFRRRVAAENLARAFGGTLAPSERARLCHAAFRSGGRFFVECLRLRRYQHSILQRVTVHGLDHLRDALSERRGVLLFTGHLGNWELIGPSLVASGLPVTLLVGQQKNAPVDALLNRRRRELGQTVIPIRGGMREAAVRLRAGEIVGVLIDQRIRRGGVLVPFFGHPASTSPVLARLAFATGAVVVPISIQREADHVHHRVTIEPPLSVSRTGDRDRDIADLTARATQAVEGMVRRAPRQYYWFHRRWKPPSDVR